MTPVILPAVFDLPAAGALADMLRIAPGPVVIDGSAVERVGFSGLQVLLSARKTAAAAGHDFAIDLPSEALVAAVRTAGADTLLAANG